jgi:hypothetical protein
VTAERVVHDIGASGARFPLRLVGGRALEALEKQGRSPELALHVFRQVAEALQHAHERASCTAT